MKKAWFVYMIETEESHLYTGITTDVEKRFEKHATGKGAKFFRIHKPKQVVFISKCKTKNAALKEEIKIKNLSAADKRFLTQG